MFINRYKYNPIISQQILRQSQSRIQHIQPVSVEATVALVVHTHIKQQISVLVPLTAFIGEFARGGGKIVVINKGVTSRVIRRIDIYHLDLAEIGLLQELQRIEVIAFNVDVLGVNSAGRSVTTD